jgi:hypothetical protein
MFKSAARRLIHGLGYEVVPYVPEQPLPSDFSRDEVEIIRAVRPYTMTSPERLASLIEAVKYLEHSRIAGSIVECGVWRGGSMMAAALTLLRLRAPTRDLHLFDTFEGMPKPGTEDVDIEGNAAAAEFERTRRSDDSSDYCYSPLEEVQRNLAGTGYDLASVKFIKGKVEETIPAHAPARIALLRLDTDWYESTRHELAHLFPRLVPGGVLILDDYGHWQGSRRAVDEYMAEHGIPILLNRVDYTARIAVKR